MPERAATSAAALVRVVRTALAWEWSEPSPEPRGGPLPPLRPAIERHRLAPVLAPWRDDLPLDPDDAAWLAEAGAANGRHALQTARRLVDVVATLRRANVPSLVLKGLPLALRTTGSLTGRHCGDIDIWVPMDQLATADAAVRSLGYEPLGGPASSPLSDPYRRLVLALDDQVAYASSDGFLEVHWRPTKLDLLPLEFEDAWARRREVAFAESSVDALGEIDDTLYTIVHAAKHHFTRLQWAVDVVRLLHEQDASTWSEVRCRARKAGVDIALDAASEIARRLAPKALVVGEEPITPRARRLAEAMWRTSLSGDEAGRERLRDALRLRGDARYRTRVLAAFALWPKDLDGLASSRAPLLALPARKLAGLARQRPRR